MKSLSDFILEFLCIASYVRKVMTKLCIKILVKLTLRFNQRFLSPWGVLPFACM